MIKLDDTIYNLSKNYYYEIMDFFYNRDEAFFFFFLKKRKKHFVFGGLGLGLAP